MRGGKGGKKEGKQKKKRKEAKEGRKGKDTLCFYRINNEITLPRYLEAITKHFNSCS
jgi:hypothetical protein